MYTNIISNPTWDTIKQFMQDALRCTWPNISVIRSHCEVELMLDRSARSLAKLYQGTVSCKPIPALYVLYETLMSTTRVCIMSTMRVCIMCMMCSMSLRGATGDWG